MRFCAPQLIDCGVPDNAVSVLNEAITGANAGRAGQPAGGLPTGGGAATPCLDPERSVWERRLVTQYGERANRHHRLVEASIGQVGVRQSQRCFATCDR